MDRFVPRDDALGCDDGVGCDDRVGCDDGVAVIMAPCRHCESRSDVAIHGVVRRPMDRFVPRDDAVGCDDDVQPR